MSEAVFPRRTRRRSPAVSHRIPPVVTVLMVVVAIVTALYMLAVAVVLPRVRISRIHVQADFEISRQELLSLAGLDTAPFYFSVRPGEVAQRLEELPLIKTAVVERVFPDTVRLDLQRRRPVALVFFSRNGRLVPAVLDEQGVIFDTGPHLAELDLPVISGIEFQGSPLGSRMPDMVAGFLHSLHELQVEEPRLFDRLSELHVVPRRNGGFDVLMFTADYRVPIRLGMVITPELSRWSLMVLDVLSQQGIEGEVSEVDFRSGEIVYRMKEDGHGR